MTGNIVKMEEDRSAFKIFTGKSPRLRWEDNIRKDLKEMGINTKDFVGCIQDTDYWRAFVNKALLVLVNYSRV